MRVSHRFLTRLEWTGDTSGQVVPPGKPALKVSPPPEFRGPEGVWTPEDMFLASLDTCLMLTFLAHCRARKVKVLAYASRAEGLLEGELSAMAFTRVDLYPEVEVEPEQAEEAAAIMARAGGQCLVSRSVACAVEVHPRVAAHVA